MKSYFSTYTYIENYIILEKKITIINIIHHNRFYIHNRQFIYSILLYLTVNSVKSCDAYLALLVAKFSPVCKRSLFDFVELSGKHNYI